jgi:signal transduction histidine kinase/HAMP domain-containing protein
MMRLVPRSLRAHLLLIVLIASVPVVALTLVDQIRHSRATLEQQRQASARMANSLAVAQQRTFELSRGLLVSISRLPPVREHQPSCPAVLREMRAANPFFTNIVVADADGTLICSALPLIPSTDAASEPWFLRALRERAFTIGDAQVGRLTQRHVYVFAQPVLDGDGRVTHVVFAGFDLSWFDRLIADSDLPPGAVVTVLDHDGQIAWQSRDLEQWAMHHVTGMPLYRLVVTQRRGAAAMRGFDNVARYYVFAPWGGDGADEKYIAIGFPEDEILSTFTSSITWKLAALLVVGLVIAFGTHRASDVFMLRPVERLVAMTNRVTEGDLTARVEEGGAEEIVALARSFNAMAQALEDRGRDRDSAETALAEAQSRLVQILQTIPVGVIVVNPNGAPYLVNRTARTLCGDHALSVRTAHELCERLGLRNLNTGAMLRGNQCPMDRALAGERVYLPAVELVNDGRSVPVEVWAAPIFQSSGAVENAILALHDLTEQRALEDQYRQSQKMEAIGRLAGGVAHDFNNLLTVILGYADMLLEEERGIKLEVQAIRDAGERARALTQQLLAFSRKQVLQPQIVDINEQMKTLGRLLRRLLGEDVELVLQLATESVVVSVDPGQFDQIAMNIAVNARDAMPEGGTLLIETALVRVGGGLSLTPELGSGDYVMVAFHDSGVGMDEATRARVFEPFFTTKERGKGTGLGMATVYGIVSQSGGTITVHSRPGHGTCFRVCLPAADACGLPAAAAAAVASAGGGSETILVVEDDGEVLQFAKRVLRQRGYEVHAVDSGEAALQLLGSHDGRIDLLLTDIVLKGINGRRLAALVEEARPSISVLYMSGYTENVLRSDDASLAFLQKPFTPAQLADAVRRTLDLRHVG